MLNWKLAVLFSAVILTGCANEVKPVDVPLEPLPTAHVNWPTPLTPCQINLAVMANGDSANVVIPYQDYLTLRACDADKNRYISNMNSMTCFYRKDLNEPRCAAYTTKEDTTK